MRSRIFECEVMHHRFTPKRHRFVYRIFMLAVDLDELPVIARTTRLLRINRAGLFSLRERDYLPVSQTPHNPPSRAAANVDAVPPRPGLRERVAGFLNARGIELGAGRVELVTMPRVAGYLFNPVSFYFCHDASGRPLAAIAEVTNTFREVKPFLLSAAGRGDGTFRARLPKAFYVSPYSEVDDEFDFILRPAADRLAVQIDDYAGEYRVLTSVLTGRARALHDRALAVCAVKYPLLTLRVIAAIHWHALLLWAKRVPWFRKAARAGAQRDLYRPHRSLTAIPAAPAPLP